MDVRTCTLIIEKLLLRIATMQLILNLASSSALSEVLTFPDVDIHVHTIMAKLANDMPVVSNCTSYKINRTSTCTMVFCTVVYSRQLVILQTPPYIRAAFGTKVIKLW